MLAKPLPLRVHKPTSLNMVLIQEVEYKKGQFERLLKESLSRDFQYTDAHRGSAAKMCSKIMHWWEQQRLVLHPKNVHGPEQ